MLLLVMYFSTHTISEQTSTLEPTPPASAVPSSSVMPSGTFLFIYYSFRTFKLDRFCTMSEKGNCFSFCSDYFHIYYRFTIHTVPEQTPTPSLTPPASVVSSSSAMPSGTYNYQQIQSYKVDETDT